VTPTILSSSPIAKRISVKFGAREMMRSGEPAKVFEAKESRLKINAKITDHTFIILKFYMFKLKKSIKIIGIPW
jgi:hypothetical protein